jgi:hypothetical protein
MFTLKSVAKSQALGVGAYALSTAILERLVAKGFLTEAAATEIIHSAAREVRKHRRAATFGIAAEQLDATAERYSTQVGGPSITIRNPR